MMILQLKQKEKKATKKIKASELRKQSYKYITKYIGRGEKLSLQKLQIKNKEGNIERCIYKKEEVEKAVIKYNCKHYKKAHSSKCYKDKVYNQLQNNTLQDKILNDRLKREDYTYEEVYKFFEITSQQECKQLPIPTNNS